MRPLLILMLILCTDIFALDTDKNAPLYVEAKHVIYDREKHTVIYLEKVHAHQGSTHIDGDKVFMYLYPNNKVHYLIDYGNLAHYDTLPKPNKPRLYAQGNEIHYDPNAGIVVIIHQAKVTQEGNSFIGPKITYLITQGIINSDSDDKDHLTHITIQAQKPLQ